MIGLSLYCYGREIKVFDSKTGAETGEKLKVVEPVDVQIVFKTKFNQ